MEIKKKAQKILFAGLFAIAFLAACNKQNIDTASTNLPVVEAYLLPGHALTVKLFQQKAITDTAKYGPAISGLQVFVSDGAKNVQLTSSSAGTYVYSDTTFLVAGKTYTLQFKYLSYQVSAKTVMPARPANFKTQYGTITLSTTSTPNTPETILDKLTWDNPDSLNHVLVFNNADATSFPVSSGFGGSNRSANFQLNTDQASYYNITQNIFPYYGHYQVVLLRVNQEYIDLLKSNTSNSTSQNLLTIPGNIVNGFGIFTAMQADTVSLNVF